MLRTTKAAVLLAAVAIGLAPASAWALAGGTANFRDAANNALYHPDLARRGQSTFSIFTYGSASTREQALADAGFSFVDSLVSPFSSAVTPTTFTGTVTSEVWRSEADDHLLFLYQITNTAPLGGTPFTGLSLDTQWGNHPVSDAGIVREGSDDFQQGDVTAMIYPGGPYITYMSNGFFAPIRPGESGNWFYLESFSTHYGPGSATVGFLGTVNGVGILVPMPEPLTMASAGLAVSAVGGYVLRRRRRK